VSLAADKGRVPVTIAPVFRALVHVRTQAHAGLIQLPDAPAGRPVELTGALPGSAIALSALSMIRALLLALRQLADPAVQRLLLRCVLLTLATFVVLIGAVAALLFGLDLTGLSWLDPVLATAGSAVVLVLAWLLFPVAVGLILGLFAEDVVELVERRHYPELPKAPGMSLAAQAYTGVRFLIVALPLNLIALPLYLIPGANLPVYLALNGYLLGREYFELVAGQRLPLREVSRLRREQRGRLWLAGVVIALMLLIPVFNLVAPVVAIAFMVHLVTPLVSRAAHGAHGRFASVGERARNSTGERRKHLTSRNAPGNPACDFVSVRE
jgi:CysZ protein